MKKYKKIGVASLILFIPLFVLILIKNIRISEISCRSQFGECTQQLKAKLESIGNCDYFTCKNSVDSALSENYLINSYTYQLKLPLRIEVGLVEKSPKYSITKESEILTAQIDDDGLVLNIRQESALPGFNTQSDLPKPGDKVLPEVLFALELTYSTSKIQEIKEAKLDNNLLTVDLKDGKRVLFPLSGDRDFILGSLALILNELKKSEMDSRIESRKFSIIDLRYKNPVLK